VNLHSEIIDLASEGYFYPSSSIYSSGTVKILPITAAQEELLCNVNLAKRGLLETEFLDSVVEGGINPTELLYCDKLSIMLNLRIANYGVTSRMRVGCEKCDTEYEQDISFGFRSTSFNFSKYERGVNKLYYTFPKCKKNVVFKLPNCAEYDVYIKHGWLAFAKLITLSVDNVEYISNFYEYELGATDSAAFRKHFENNTPGYINTVSLSCTSCNHVKKNKIDVNTDIYGIRPESKMNIHSEIFDLCYYSNGAFTQEGVYKMPTMLRAFYIKKLVDVKKAEAEANKAASEGKGKSDNIARPPAVKK
jgi:hypothetical protein